MSQLQDNLNEILRQKNLYLLPENIREGVTILGVTGTLVPSGPEPEPEPTEIQTYYEIEYD